MSPSRKASRSGFDYAVPAGYQAPPAGYPGHRQYPVQYPTLQAYPPGYGGYMNGYGSGYGHAYGAEGYHHYMRNHDPSYDAFDTEGPTVDDKWRNTYPYVPTSYSNHSEGRSSTNRRRPPLGADAPDSVSAAAPPLEDGVGPKFGGETDYPPDSNDGGGDSPREHWGSQWEFIFSCVGLSVGIGNVWRFPYLAYDNGGGAFLLPYFILLILVGKPLYYMEVALGQFSQLGPLAVWKLIPVGRGVGFAMCTLSLIVAIYYNVVMGYCLFYIYGSFAEVLPWNTCNHNWTDARCYVRTDPDTAEGEEEKAADVTCAAAAAGDAPASACQSAAEQYWEKFVLGIDRAPLMVYTEPFNATSEVQVNRTYALVEFGQIGELRWDLALCLFLSWLVVFLSLSKGIRSSGKVVYFTATFPYVILVVLLVRGLFLEGAWEGIKFFFVPEWEKLLDITVWRKAAEQMFFSLSVSWGGLIMFGSYNKFRTRVHIHALVISSLDFVTSIIAGVVIFSVLGELKLKLGLDDIRDVVQQKQGLAFVAYPEAVSLLPWPQLWSVLFFFMLFTLGLDSEFALLETVLTGVYDVFPPARKHKAKICFVLCFVCFLLSLPCISTSGQFIFDLMDTYGGGLGVLWVAIFETFVLMWIYGVNRFSDDVAFMLRIKGGVSWYWKLCWLAAPVILAAIFGIACWFWTVPTYGGADAPIHYTEWAHGVGWFLTLSVALQIPLIGLFVLLYYAAKGKAAAAFKANPHYGPGDPDVAEEYRQHLYRKAFKCKQHPHGYGHGHGYGYYDNYAMHYPYYNTYAAGAQGPPTQAANYM